MPESAPEAVRDPDDVVRDPERLEALRKTGMLDTAPEAAIDRFTKLATQILGVKVSLLSLVDADRQFLKSSFGLNEPWASERELPLSHSFAKLIVASGEPLVIEDAREEERVRDSLAIEELGIVAYAAFPLRTTAGGHVLGSFCAIDDAPHTWTGQELELLNGFSDAVMAHVEMREAKQEAEQAKQEAEQAQQQAEQAQQEAEAANAAKSRFVANMSHELRTPLNSVIGYSEMFMKDLDEWDEERVKDGLRRIHASGHELLDLINDVLDLSKAETDRLSLLLAIFPLAPLVEQAAEAIRPVMRENGNDFDLRGLDAVGEVCTDESKLRRILNNLLSNAAKYTEDGTVTVKVETREDVEDCEIPGEASDEAPGTPREVVLAVSDTGIGMTEEEQESIFEAFNRAEEGGVVKGTGLGLGIVQNLCDLLGGSVEMESEKGVGSTFTVRLPMKTYPEGETSEEDARPPVQAPASPTNASPTRTPPPCKDDLVLVIDDDRDARILMRNYLSEAGYQVETASTGAEGLEQSHELHPTAIILDVLMEEMGGWEVLERLKEDPHLRSIPVCMITIVGDEERGIQLGAAEYLIKPVDRDHLIDLLEEHRSGPSPFSVLVIDDDRAVRDVTRQIIEEEAGHEVHAAKTGRAALDLLEEGLAPHFVLLDLLMPEMDGFAFLEASREHLRGVPVVVLTAKDLTDEDIHRLEGQAESIIQKEGHPREDLLREVKEGVKRLREEKASM